MQPLFQTQALVHVSCVDFCVLWGFFAPVLGGSHLYNTTCLTLVFFKSDK